MPIIRVQYRRRLIGAPEVGQWSVYSNAYFDVPSTTISPTQSLLVADLFCGNSAGNVANDRRLGQAMFTTGAAAGTLTAWEVVAGSFVKIDDFNLGNRVGAATVTYLPFQSAIAVGYRSASTPGVAQRGRSRWFLGPLALTAGSHVQNVPSGGCRLTTDGVDKILSNALSCLADLEATHGWTLQVRTKVGGTVSFNPALEIYVDDVIDVMRSRRPWQLYQARSPI